MPLGLLHPLAGLLVDVALVRCDGEVGDLDVYRNSLQGIFSNRMITMSYRTDNFPVIRFGVESTLYQHRMKTAVATVPSGRDGPEARTSGGAEPHYVDIRHLHAPNPEVGLTMPRADGTSVTNNRKGKGWRIARTAPSRMTLGEAPQFPVDNPHSPEGNTTLMSSSAGTSIAAARRVPNAVSDQHPF